jgi:ABC-type nitrate/sulfonate/bicarbonate transport system permease component
MGNKIANPATPIRTSESTSASDVVARVEPSVEVLGPPPRAASKVWIARLISMFVIVGGWEVLGRRVSPVFLSYPTAIVKAGIAMALSGELTDALAMSLQTLVVGFLLASFTGVILGLLIGRYKFVDAATDWLINALYATPLVAIIPLVILWFGLGNEAKLFIVSILTVFPVLINTAAGVRNVPQALIDVSTAFAANERQVFMKIILPAAVPYMMTGLRLGIGRAIIGMVVAEFFTAITGLGAVIVKYGNQYDTASMFVPILVLMLLGVVLTYGVRRLEEMFAPWRNVD